MLYVAEPNQNIVIVKLLSITECTMSALMKKAGQFWRSQIILRVESLWSSGQSSWLQIQRSVFDSRRYQIFWEVVGLERGPLSLVSTIEELLERKSSGFGLENREYGRRVPLWWLRNPIYPQKLTLTSSTSCSLSIGIVRSRTKATEFSFS
jgi:hypothetical protein